jgi:parallel beta helix pectate lyase-like protein
MARRAQVRRTVVLAAVLLVAAALLPAQGVAARLKARSVTGGVVVRLVGAKPHAVRYTLGGHAAGHARRAPYSLVLQGLRPASGIKATASLVKLVARNSRTGRRLAVITLQRSRVAKPPRTQKPTVSYTKTPSASTSATTASFSFKTTNAGTTTCSLDGSAFVACSSPVAFNGVALGGHALTVFVSNSGGLATAVANWAVVPPPPPSPSSAGETSTAPVTPPSSYAIPSTAVTISDSAQLKQALGGAPKDIVVADGVYDSSSPFVNANGHRIYAQHLGGAVFKAGFVMGGNWGPGHGVLQGLAFDVSDSSKVLEGSIVHVWGTGAGTQVLDTTFDGHGVIASGLLARQVEGLVVRRVVGRNFRDSAVLVDPNVASYNPATPPVLEDIDSANVTWPVARSSNGTSEACVWVGVTATLRRIKTRDCAWEGLWVGSGTRNSVFEDLDINDSGVGIYIEHFASGSTFRRAHVGPNVERGATCEWADPAWGSRPACTDNVFEDSYFNTRLVGVYLDEGTTRTTVRHSVFVNQACGAIGNYAGVGNLWDTSGNDYSGIRASAVPVYTHHLYSC